MLSVRNANISLGTNGGKKCIRVAITFHTGSPCTSERNGILLNNHFLECAFPINSRTPAVWRNKRADNGRVNSDKACLYAAVRARSLLLSAGRRKRNRVLGEFSARRVHTRSCVLREYVSRLYSVIGGTRCTRSFSCARVSPRNSSNHRRLNIESLAISGVTRKKEQRKAINARASRAADEWCTLSEDPS